MTEAAVVRVTGEAAEVARAEAQAVLAMVQDEERRGRLADLVAAIDEGEVGERRRRARSPSCSSSACRPAASARSTGPRASRPRWRSSAGCRAGRELTQSTRDLNAALEALEGRTLERVSVSAVGPGEYGVTISTDDYELVLRLGRAGARLATIGA